jgi:hypothetical protein
MEQGKLVYIIILVVLVAVAIALYGNWKNQNKIAAIEKTVGEHTAKLKHFPYGDYSESLSIYQSQKDKPTDTQIRRSEGKFICEYIENDDMRSLEKYSKKFTPQSDDVLQVYSECSFDEGLELDRDIARNISESIKIDSLYSDDNNSDIKSS